MARRLPVPVVAVPVLIAAVQACDPCRAFSGTEFSDPAGALPEGGLASLVQTTDEFLAWTASDGICIQRVEVEPLRARAGQFDPHGRSWVISIDTDAAARGTAYAEEVLRHELCHALDETLRYSSERADLFPASELDASYRLRFDGARRGEVFAEACESGPPAIGWWEQVEAACGSSDVSEQQRFLADVVYRDAPPARLDGDLTATAEPERRVPLDGPFGSLLAGIEPAGDQIALAWWWREREQAYTHVTLLDPSTGASRTVIPRLPVEGWSRLVGGPESAVLVVDAGDDHELIVIDDGATRTLRTVEGLSFNGAMVSGGVLYTSAYPYLTRPVTAIDLATGVMEQIDLPPVAEGREALVNGMVPAPGGLLLERLEATVEADYDSVTTWVHSSALLRYRAADRSWEEVDPEHGMELLGTTASGLVVGTLDGGVGELLGAWDLEADALLVSEQLCGDRDGDVGLVVGERAYVLSDDGVALTLAPYALSTP